MYGKSRGVKNVSLKVEAGTIFGFLGPNGAGKTTTISMLVDFIRPTEGKINIFGLDSVAQSVEIRKRVGFLAGDFALDGSLTGMQQLEYLGNLRGGVAKTRIAELGRRFECRLNRPIKTLSRGNKQKVGLISALMHDPELLIFDEPTSGLDPLMQAEFNKIIMEHKQQDKTAFISSHVLSEVQEICDHVAFIREGKVIATKHTAKLAAQSPKRIHIIGASSELRGALKQMSQFKLLTSKGVVVEGTFGGDINGLITLLGKYKLQNVTIQDADLETIFMKYYGDQ